MFKCQVSLSKASPADTLHRSQHITQKKDRCESCSSLKVGVRLNGWQPRHTDPTPVRLKQEPKEGKVDIYWRDWQHSEARQQKRPAAQQLTGSVD